MSRFGAMIDCEGQRVVDRTPSGGELVIYGEDTRLGSGFCSATKARRYIQHGCAGYLAYMVDTWVRDQVSVSDVPVVRNFIDVFSEELPGAPPKRQVEFMIDSGPGAAPIAKAQLAAPEM